MGELQCHLASSQPLWLQLWPGTWKNFIVAPWVEKTGNLTSTYQVGSHSQSPFEDCYSSLKEVALEAPCRKRSECHTCESTFASQTGGPDKPNEKKHTPGGVSDAVASLPLTVHAPVELWGPEGVTECSASLTASGRANVPRKPAVAEPATD